MTRLEKNGMASHRKMYHEAAGGLTIQAFGYSKVKYLQIKLFKETNYIRMWIWVETNNVVIMPDQANL